MAEIVEFRAKMKTLDQRLVGHALRVSQLRRRRRNMEVCVCVCVCVRVYVCVCV